MASEKRADNARLKLGRAKQHAETVKADIVQWTELQSKKLTAVTIGKEFDVEKGCFVMKVTEFEGLPARWSLMTGDALYNCRAALEYLAWHLIRAGTEPKPKNPKAVQFPIYTDPKDFNKYVKSRLPGVRPIHLTVVEKYQPYNVGQRASHHPLAVLVDLSNTDKHYELQGAFIRHYGEMKISVDGASDFDFERVELPRPVHDYFLPGVELAYAYGRITGPKPQVRFSITGKSAICLQNGMWLGDALDKIGATILELIEEIEPLL